MKRCDQLNEANDKTFQVYESQVCFESVCEVNINMLRC